MKNICFAISVLSAFCLISILNGCQLPPQTWHLQARKDGDTVRLCLSHEADCPQPGGVGPDSISVYRYDNTFNNELVWDAMPENPLTNDGFNGVFTYGIAPKHWRNQLTPPALVCGKAYLVNPAATLFGLKCDGTVVVFDFPQLEEFFRQNAPPAPTKERAGN
jgi:hypothetical protein